LNGAWKLCWLVLGDAAWPERPWVLEPLLLVTVCGPMAQWVSVLLLLPRWSRRSRVQFWIVHLFFLILVRGVCGLDFSPRSPSSPSSEFARNCPSNSECPSKKCSDSAQTRLGLRVPFVQASLPSCQLGSPRGLARTPCRLRMIPRGLARNTWGTVKTSTKPTT
jgi:hypothetical protein